MACSHVIFSLSKAGCMHLVQCFIGSKSGIIECSIDSMQRDIERLVWQEQAAAMRLVCGLHREESWDVLAMSAVCQQTIGDMQACFLVS